MDIFNLYYPLPPRNTTHYLRLTKLDNTLATYIHGYYRVLSYIEKKTTFSYKKRIDDYETIRKTNVYRLVN